MSSICFFAGSRRIYKDLLRPERHFSAPFNLSTFNAILPIAELQSAEYNFSPHGAHSQCHDSFAQRATTTTKIRIIWIFPPGVAVYN